MFNIITTTMNTTHNTRQHNTATCRHKLHPLPSPPFAHTHTHTHTNAEDVEVEAFVDTLVDQLVWKAVKPNVARESQVPAICPLGGGTQGNKSRGNMKSLKPRVERKTSKLLNL